MDLPSTRTLTSLFTDVEGSTQLRERFPDALDEALALWRELLEAWLAERGAALAPTSTDELRRALGLGED